jgi:hypothetical protein
MQTTATALELYDRGIKDRVKTYSEKQPNFWKDIVGSVQEERDLWVEKAALGGFGIATTQREAGGVPFDNITTPYTLKYFQDIYSIGFELSDQAKERDLSGEIAKRAPGMARSIYWAKEQSVADVLNNGTTSGYTGIDGVTLSSASHPTESTTWSNQSTAATLSIDALETMLNNLITAPRSYRDAITPQMGPFRLVVPGQLGMRAQRLLAGVEQPQTANRERNVAKTRIADYSVNPYLTDTDGFWLLPMEDNPIFMLKYQDVRFRESYDGRKPAWLYTAHQEWGLGWDWPFGIQHNAGA